MAGGRRSACGDRFGTENLGMQWGRICLGDAVNQPASSIGTKDNSPGQVRLADAALGEPTPKSSQALAGGETTLDSYQRRDQNGVGVPSVTCLGSFVGLP